MAISGLARLRFAVESTLGRRYPEIPHPYRTEFQRDRDRIVHARAFRRLEDKTQVFSSSAAGSVVGHFRNRLTHTIEVSQIARTVAGALGLNEDLTEVLALVHDIGHPPFAHAGETELNQQMLKFNDRFDHNLHSLRIVEGFERRYARFPGLNLTFEVREGIAKHSRDFEPGEDGELDQYLPGLRPPLEAQLIDLADEIAYNTADLDDGFTAGFFSAEDIAAEVPWYAGILETVDTQFGGATPEVRFLEALRALIDWLVSGLIQGTAESASAANVETVEQVRIFPQRIAALTQETAKTNRALKSFLHRRVYNSDSLSRERERAAGMIAELFQFLLDRPALLPQIEEGMEQPVHRRICDYIAGLTDGHFRKVYYELKRPYDSGGRAT